jgi:beta-lactam-binding protein with PASTA domain
VAALLIFPAPLLPSEREVPRVIGTTADEASRLLAQAGLRGEVADRERHATMEAGQVTWQDPPPGVAVPRGTAVALTISEGTPRVALPDVGGLDPQLAQRLLWAAGVTVSSADTVGSSLPAGLAVGTTPAARESVATGGAVILHLSKGTK